MSNNSLRNYEIRQKLGSGSYGVIYKAVNKTDKSVCVLKQIALTRMSEKARKNAANEAHIMGKLKHPFIVCYYNSFVEDNNLNILMEFCEGGDLCCYLKQQNKKYLKEDKIWKFFIEICMGLQHIHKNKILHRDIKTLNIFLNKTETVKIGDLGVAKALNANDFAHTMVGTPFYLSPELCQQKPYNEKSDIWALGCLLYELCTFKHPFQATNQASLILKIIRGKYQPIPQFYSKQLREMIDLCLERDYKRRPTANMILTKPHVKKLIESFELQKTIDQFYVKNNNNAVAVTQPKHQNKQQSKLSEQKSQAIKSESKSSVEKPQPVKCEIKSSAQKPKKYLDGEGAANSKPPLPPKLGIQQVAKQEYKDKKIQPKPQQNLVSKRRDSQPAIKVSEQKQQKPKILFGKTPENKIDFVNALQAKLNIPEPKIIEMGKAQNVVKKYPISFQIPIKSNEVKKSTSEKVVSDIEKHIQKKDIKSVAPINSKNAAVKQSVSVGNVVQIVKMEKKVQPKVFEQIKVAQKPVPSIKSGGFYNEPKRVESAFDKKSQPASKINENMQRQSSQSNSKEEHKLGQKVISNSVKNIRKKPEEKEELIIRKQSVGQNKLYYPPIPKKPINGQTSRKQPPKQLSNQKKAVSMSISRFTQVTKQQQDLVANLPDIVKKQPKSSDEEEEAKSHRQIKFKEIDNTAVAKMYEQMIQSNKSSQRYFPHDKSEEQQQIEEQYNDSDIKEIIENESNKINDEQTQQNEMISSEMFYEVNKYEIGDQQHLNQHKISKSQTVNEEHQWSFDEQPQLPLMEQTQTPLFEQANPYLVQEEEETFEKTEQQLIEDKKIHLQMKLKQNFKRQDEINRLMQLKIEQCRAMTPKYFDEILNFFRSKINMEKQYTDEDEKEVQKFLAERNLTDQRKFQNIYKIMHFQMELDNTRKIIQSICKKLTELEHK